MVPTYRRPEALERCLAGLARQEDPPDETIVVRRPDDDEVEPVAGRAHLPVAVHLVPTPGVVAAMALGAQRASAEVVAFCDDDAVPRADWVARIRSAFEAEPGLGALGGRDLLGPPHPEYPLTEHVGLVNSWGRLRGEHHRGAGRAREVDVLKAVNLAVRRSALAFPDGLRGRGAQVHFEVPLSLWAKDRGWQVRFDPFLVVDHHPQQRHDVDGRDRPARAAVTDASFNYTLGLLSLRPQLRRRRLAYGLLVGDRAAPGMLRAAVATVRRDRETVRRLVPSLAGQLQAVRALEAGGGVTMRPIEGS